MNKIEREAIILNSAWKMIDGMVNWAMFVRTDLKNPTNLLFQDEERQRLFMILLGDFLSQIQGFRNKPVPFGLSKAPRDANLADRTFIFHLRQVCEAPQFGNDTSDLQKQIEAFAEWLEEEFVAPEVHLPDIDMQLDLHIKRYRYIKLCGDIAKHHLGRLSANVRHVKDLLNQSGQNIDSHTVYLAFENFFDWFFDDIFICHSSQIAEFLNNIRWEIFHYLELEFARSYHLTENATPDFPAYRYNVPEDIHQPIAHAMYWDVMNRMLRKPLMPRFVIHETFKRRY